MTRLLTPGLCLLLVPLTAPAASETTAQDAARNMDEYLERLVPFGFSGTVFFARDGEVLLNKG
jgi:hypothetical protein